MAISLIAAIVLSLAVVRIWQSERAGSRALLAAPLLATALLELSDLCAVSGLAPELPWKTVSVYLEGFLPVLWLSLSFSHARERGVSGIGTGARLLLGLSSLLVVIPFFFPVREMFYAPDFPSERILFLTNAGYFYYVSILALLICALTNFETTLVNAPPEARSGVKLSIVALGAMLAVSIFYYSSAVLYRTLNMELVPLRSLLYAVAALLISYWRSGSRAGARIRISQRVLLRSAVLAMVAGYLLVLGALGEGMKYFGAQFPRVLTLSLAFLSGIVLMLVLLSDRLKRELKVFLHKNFYQSKYDYRAQWLDVTRRLASVESGDDLLKKVLYAYCEIFGVKGGAIFLHQEGGGWFCAAGVQEMEDLHETLADDNPLLCYLREKGWVFCSRDDNPEIVAKNRTLIRHYQVGFVVPLFESEQLTGFIALGQPVVPDEQYRYEDYDLMKTIARQASVAIQHQRLSEQLTQAKAMEAVGNLATFVAHDLKNLAATVSLIVENAREHLDNPEFQKDMLLSLKSTSEKMHGLIASLKNYGEGESFQMRTVDLLALVERSANLVQNGNITVQGAHQSAVADETELQKVVLNLLVNGIEASQTSAPIVVEVGFAGAPFIRVTDRGCGMSPRFVRSELFAPFRTTKDQGLGIGMYQCRQIVAAHGGRMEVSSVEGFGTVFTVWLPALTGPVGVVQAA